MQSSAVATVNGTAISTTGYDFVALDISGITTATITFEITEDESTWRSVTAINRSTKAESTTATADGSYIVNVAGAVKMRARISSWTSGTIIVYGRAGKGPMPIGGTSTVDTELPAAAALADATANPTVPAVGSFMHGFNGTTWDRIRTAITTATSTFTGILNSLPLLKYNATAPTLTDGQVIVQQADVNGNTKTSMATALSKNTDSITSRPEGTTYVNLTASALVRTGAGILVGMYVNSTTGGTIKFWDQTSAASPVMNNTITPAIGYHPLGNGTFGTGLYATIANTLDVTLYYIATP